MYVADVPTVIAVVGSNGSKITVPIASPILPPVIAKVALTKSMVAVLDSNPDVKFRFPPVLIVTPFAPFTVAAKVILLPGTDVFETLNLPTADTVPLIVMLPGLEMAKSPVLEMEPFGPTVNVGNRLLETFKMPEIGTEPL